MARQVVAAAQGVALAAAERARALDLEGRFPKADVEALAEAGLLAACVPARLGGAGLGSDALGSQELSDVLRLVGRGNLALGRLYEGHVNAWRLIARNGELRQMERLAADARSGHFFGVWNTDAGDGLRLVPLGARYWLEGRKILCSGAGHLTRPLVTARLPDGLVRMVVVPLEGLQERSDAGSWDARGMRASVSGGFDFTGIEVGEDLIVGEAGAYLVQPDFSCGAWRFCAVQLGGIEALFDGLREHLRRTGRGGNAHQAARLGQMAIAVQTARLWVERAATMAARAEDDPARAVAFVNLTRLVVERAGLDAIELAERSIGLRAFLKPDPLERMSRDLATYLRQPNPDGALMAAAERVLADERDVAALWS